MISNDFRLSNIVEVLKQLTSLIEMTQEDIVFEYQLDDFISVLKQCKTKLEELKKDYYK